MKTYGLYESASVKVRYFPLILTYVHAHGQYLLDPNLQNSHRGRFALSSVQEYSNIFQCASQAARMLLRVDDVVQATRKDKEQGQSQGPPPEEMEG
jgi:hypothetical protein